jgi:hypothetical protein
MRQSQQQAKASQIRAMILLLVFAGIFCFDAGRSWISHARSGETPKPQGFLIRTSLSESPVGRFEKRGSENHSKKSRNESLQGALQASANNGLLALIGPYRFATHIERSPSLNSISPSSDRAPPCM